MMLFHIGLPAPATDGTPKLERLCFLAAGPGDDVHLLGARCRVIPPWLAAKSDTLMPEGACICVACAQKLKARGQVPFDRTQLRVIAGGRA